MPILEMIITIQEEGQSDKETEDGMTESWLMLRALSSVLENE